MGPQASQAAGGIESKLGTDKSILAGWWDGKKGLDSASREELGFFLQTTDQTSKSRGDFRKRWVFCEKPPCICPAGGTD